MHHHPPWTSVYHHHHHHAALPWPKINRVDLVPCGFQVSLVDVIFAILRLPLLLGLHISVLSLFVMLCHPASCLWFCAHASCFPERFRVATPATLTPRFTCVAMPSATGSSQLCVVASLISAAWSSYIMHCVDRQTRSPKPRSSKTLKP